MKNKSLVFLYSILFIMSCNNSDTKIKEKNAIPDSVSVNSSSLFAANINGIKTYDKAPLIIFKKDNAKESISISGVFNDANSHIGLLIIKDAGSLSAGKYILQQDATKTNGRYETNINGGATPVENTLYKAAGTVNIIILDTAAKKIEADVIMDAINKIQQKVHITAHVSSNYK